MRLGMREARMTDMDRTPPTGEGELARELEGLLGARRTCQAEDAADAFTHEIGLFAVRHADRILTALSTKGDAEQVREAADWRGDNLTLTICDALRDADMELLVNASMGGGECWELASQIAAAIRSMPLPKASDKTTPVADDGMREALIGLLDALGCMTAPEGHPLHTAAQKAVAALQHEGGPGDGLREALTEIAEAAWPGDDAISRVKQLARAALSAPTSGDGTVGVAEANGWERGMRDAANICGSLAETTYDDADAFEAATGCEAAIISDLRAHQRSRNGPPYHSFITPEANSKSDASPTRRVDRG